MTTPDFTHLDGLLRDIALVRNYRQSACFFTDNKTWEFLYDSHEWLIEQFEGRAFAGVCQHCLSSIHHDSKAWVHEEGDRAGFTACHKYKPGQFAEPIGKPEKPQYEGQEAA